MDINWIVDSPFEALPVGDRQATAISVDGTESLTYEQLRDRRNRFVHLLRDAGVERGDRVAIMLLNSLDYVALYFAIARMGAIAVRVNFRLSPAELSYLVNDSGCSVVVFHSSRAAQLEPIHGSVSVRRWFCVPDGDSPLPLWAEQPDLDLVPADDLQMPRPAGTDPVMLMYTSGTTGRPKGAVWTHDNSLWAASMQASKWNYTSGTVAMTSGPLYHVGALESMFLPALLVHGTGVITSSGGLTIERIVNAVREAGVTHALLYPFALYDLLRKTDLDPEHLSSLRVIVCGGDVIQPWASKAMDEKLPGIELQQAYGLTEGGSLAAVLDHRHLRAHPDSIGRPIPLTQLKIMLETGEPAGPDQVGELWVRSPAVSGTYWNLPDESRETFADGWCHTGDLGRVTSDGFLVLTGRAKDMIRSGGENIYPAEVEAVLSEHPGVAAIALVGVPDAKYLEVGCAVIGAADPNAVQSELEEDLRKLAADRLARYKCPRYYVFVDELPLNAAGKVQKRILRDLFAHLGTTGADSAEIGKSEPS
jgi:fatty-acyl-CoA synthase